MPTVFGAEQFNRPDLRRNRFRARYTFTGARVLDALCGSGRHSIELASRGCSVVGLDISAEAIAHVQRLSTDVGWQLDDVRSLASHGISADLALCMGNSFGYLTRAENLQFLTDMAEAAPVLVIDYGCSAEALLPSLPGEIRMSVGGVDMVAVNSYEVGSRRLLIDFTFRSGERTQRSACVQHVYTAGELSRMPRPSSFAEAEGFESPGRLPVSCFQAERCLALCIARF